MRFHFLAAAIAAIDSGNNLAENAAWYALGEDDTCNNVAAACYPETCSANLCDGAGCTSDDEC